MKAEKKDLIPAIVTLPLSLIMAYSSLRLGLGSAGNPGAGFFAFWISVSLAFLLLILLLRATTIRTYNTGPLFELRNLRKPISLLVLLLLYAIFFKPLGFLLTTAFLVFFMLKAIAKEGFGKSIVLSLAITLLSYLLFVSFLGLSLPEGLISSFLRGS